MLEQKNRPAVVSQPLLADVHNVFDLAAVREAEAMLARGEAVAVQWEVDQASAEALFADSVDSNVSHIFAPETESKRSWSWEDMSVLYAEQRTQNNRARRERRRARKPLSRLNQTFQRQLEAEMDKVVSILMPSLQRRLAPVPVDGD